MHHLYTLSRRKGVSLHRSMLCQDLVRFFVYLRIKQHTPPLVRVPVNSFEFFLRSYYPGGELIALTSALSFTPTLSSHRLRRGLPGYLILFAPHAFVPQRQFRPSKLPSPLVFLHISTHSTATHGIPLTSTVFKSASFICLTQLS